jgi:deuterolysin
LPPKGTAEFLLDVAHLYDVSEGGEFEVLSQGTIPFAVQDSTLLTGTAAFSSNLIKLNIVKGTRKPLERTVLQGDCTGSRYRDTVDANAMCALMSSLAGYSALKGDPET